MFLLGSDEKVSPSLFWRIVLAMTLLGLVLRGLILAEFLREHPAALHPWTDGQFYWGWAGRMANGDWLPEAPFLSAPLYPLLLGVLRWMGATLPIVYVVQLMVHLGTGALLAGVARSRMGERAALMALLLFLLAVEPAYGVTRPLGNTLVLLGVVGVYGLCLWVSSSAEVRLGRSAVLGAAMGGLILAWPPAQLLLLLAGGHLFWRWGKSRRALLGAAVIFVVACAVVSPATCHNYRVTGHFIPVTAHAGITMAQGNSSGSEGVHTRIPGVAPGRGRLHESAARVYEKQSGNTADWVSVDGFFRNQALTYIWENPRGAVVLMARKAWFFLTSRHYDDIMPVSLDARFGLADMRWLAPLATPWLFGLALLGAWAMATQRRGFVEAMFVAVPAFVVMMFYYSQRYRLPLLPIVCALGGLGVVRLAVADKTARWIWLAVAVAPLVFSGINRAVGFDRPEAIEASYRPLLAWGYESRAISFLAAKDVIGAMKAAHRSLETVHTAGGHEVMGAALVAQGAFPAAREHLLEAARLTPGRTAAWVVLFNIDVESGDRDMAQERLERLLELRPGLADFTLRRNWFVPGGPDEHTLRALAEIMRRRGRTAMADRFDGWARLKERDEPTPDLPDTPPPLFR